MAKLVSAKCPHCGAPVQIPPDLDHVICGYCQHGSSIQRGRSVASPPQGPVIHVPTTSWNPVVFAIVGGTLLFGSAISALMAQLAKPGLISGGIATAGEPSLYFSDIPFLFDVNGDGVIDVIGKSEIPAGATWIAAYDGRNGKELWRTSEISKEAAGGLRGLASDVLVSVDELGKVQAYRAHNGQPAWASQLGEQARDICRGEGFVRIRTADNQQHSLSLATGQKLLNQADTPCRTIPITRSDTGIGYRVVSWTEFRKLGLPDTSSIPGMSAHRALVPDEGKRAFMLGSKSPGSSVAMIAAVEGKKVLWSSLVPGIDPLTTDVNVTTQIAAVSGSRVVVPYRLKTSNGVRMAAFDTNTGTRLWDVAVHDKSDTMNGIAATEQDVYFASWTALYVLRADTGELRFRVGKEF